MIDAATIDAKTIVALPSTPYRGIESYRYVDQPIFFGRSEETQRLIRYIAIYRGVLLYGDSGCGKSSLINAGLIPAAFEEGFLPNRIRVQPRAGEEIVIERLIRIDATAPGEKPSYLPSSFTGDSDTAPRVVLSTEKFLERLKAIAADAERRPFLIFDQFEEFVTLFEVAPQGDAIKEALAAQERILGVISYLIRDQDLPVKLLFSFREDYLAKLAKLFAVSPDLQKQYIRLTPLRTAVLHDVIRGPFERFPGHFGAEISPGLAASLESEIEVRSEAGVLNLSEVQIACLKLWQSPNPEALFQEKKVEGLLEEYLSDAINGLPEDLRDPAVALLSRLVTTAGTRNVISGDDLISLVHGEEDIPHDRLQKALDALEQQTRLVRRERRHESYFYEIVSEFLVPWIRRQKLERIAALEQRKLQAINREKRQKLIVGAGTILFLLLLAVGFLWNDIRTKDETARKEIEREKAVLEARSEADELKGEVAEKEQEIAKLEKEKETVTNQFTLAMTTKNSIEEQKTKVSSENARLNEQIKSLTAQNAKLKTDGERLLKTLESTRDSHGDRIEVLNEQIGDLKRELAACQQQLKSGSSGIQNVPNTKTPRR